MTASPSEEPHFRAELYTQEQLEVHAKALGGRHRLSKRAGAHRLLKRLDENERVLLETYQKVTHALGREQRISPAGEWLVDNFYLIQEQIRTARRHLPKQYSRQLPQLQAGPSAGQPRVYHLSWELIAHQDGRLDETGLIAFIAAYQQTTELQLGELWAVPIMLRLALIEYLRLVAEEIARAREDRDLANSWAQRLATAAQSDPGQVVLILADMARSQPSFRSAFVAEFVRLLQGKHPALALPLTWLEHRLAEHAQNIEELLQQVVRKQAANQISMGNGIASLRLLSSIDWRIFVEQLSVVERILRAEPAAIYGAMDFATRDRYRHVIEDVARHSEQTESEVARVAVAQAEAAAQAGAPRAREAHVGYYLIDDGLPELEKNVRARISILRQMARAIGRIPLLAYLGLIVAVTVIFSMTFVSSIESEALPLWAQLTGAVALILCASQLGLGVVNWLATVLIPPRSLPRMDFTKKIPADFRTMVVVPTMLASREGVADLLEALEVRYVANQEEQLYFALLTDFRDATQETMPTDAAILAEAVRGVNALNEKYAAVQPHTFFLFNRPRRWNEQEKKWMGYERKRGKIEEFNAYLQGGARDRFSTVVGEIDLLAAMRFVITLDTDTELPREAARQLVATMAHPLVRPVYDPAKHRIAHGYGILQPRVAISLPSAQQSLFAKFFSGDPGIDPYTRLVSDVYQDIFGEGSFIGKGIYEVGVFAQILGHRFPENRILSHDLLEGGYVRTALVSDVQLYEEYPAHYTADASRRHRWIRGDWQIASWLLPRVPGADVRRTANPLSGLTRWKILDNLRRSFVPAGLLALLLVSWLTLESPAFGTLAVMAMMLFPLLPSAFLEAFEKAEEVAVGAHLQAVVRRLGQQTEQFVLTLAFLPFDTWMSLDAIMRTLWRVTFSHRRLLEWQTASDAQRQAKGKLSGFFYTMMAGPVFAVVSGAVVAELRLEALELAAPLMLGWFFSPALAWWISQPLRVKEVRPTEKQEELLRQVARRTWAYFDRYMALEDHFLPPDNFQERPVVTLAHRTSPTNIGLGLTATLAACDFGYIPVGGMLDRLRNTLDTLGKMPRYRGHFYNWYDTRTLEPLPVPYVSTVDSGNLSAALLVLRQGLLEISSPPIWPSRMWMGLKDALLVVAQQVEVGRKQHRSTQAFDKIEAQIKELQVELAHEPGTITAGVVLLQRFCAAAGVMAQHAAGQEDEELRWGVELLSRQGKELLDEILALAPWTKMSASDLRPRRQTLGHPLEVFWTAVQEILRPLDARVSGSGLEASAREALSQLEALTGPNQAGVGEPERAWLAELGKAVRAGLERASMQVSTARSLAEQCQAFAEADYRFLYDETRKQMAIGYNVADRRRDAGFYDLLASEARLASFVAIAQGQLPQEHWFALGRRLASFEGRPVLYSWSGSMFEYLMPQLMMPSYPGTLLDRSNQVAVQRQIRYGLERGVPWGISESGYNATDVQLNYQYRSFGVPGLGFKRGLADDLVVAPYASVMALTVNVESAAKNLERLEDEGMLGRYGFYEAVDYTARRLPSGQKSAIVRSYMAHHGGMSLLAIAYALLGRPMQRRFLAEPRFRATELLLQEKIPLTIRISLPPGEAEPLPNRTNAAEPAPRTFNTPQTPVPEVQLLSNSNYHTMISAAGGGYSRWGDLAVTRWRTDPTSDEWGSFCYIRDTAQGLFWSATHQPTLKAAEWYNVYFQQSRVEFRRRDHDVTTQTDIGVSSEDDVEVRRIKLTNHSRTPRTLELTSYAEVVLAPPGADAAHPAFSNLFVQTQRVSGRRALLCNRRPRAKGEQSPWMFHLLAVQGGVVGEASFETDRSRFIGRGRSLEAPAAMFTERLSDTQGAVLDPMVSIRQTVLLQPDETVVLAFVTGVAPTQQGALEMVEKYNDLHLVDRVFEMAHTYSQLVRRQLNTSMADAELFSQLVGAIVQPNRLRRAGATILGRNRRSQSALWGFGLSGDLPIVLLRVADQSNLELVLKVIQAHAFWRMKGLAVDLVIWNEDRSGYRQDLQERILGMIDAGPEKHVLDRPGGIFLRKADQISEDDHLLLQTAACIVLSDAAGSLGDQMDRRLVITAEAPRLVASKRRFNDRGALAKSLERGAQDKLLFFNGLGGFTPDGKEYIISTTPEQVAPAPWVNVIANAQLGTVISESGSAYTWAENAHEFRLTPWSNDAVRDLSGEAFYLRDEERGTFWSPTPLPARGRTPYTSRHGMGYSVFEHTENGIRSELWVYVAVDAPVKFAVLKVFNESGRPRRLSATGYWEWVLGDLRTKSLLHVTTEVDAKTQALFARNPYNIDFGDRVVFVDVNETMRSVSGDRTEFLGRNGNLAHPKAMERMRLSGRTGAGLDPAAALQVPFELADQDQHELVFILGAGKTAEEARALVQRHRTTQAARQALEGVWNHWNNVLGAVQVDTPDPAVNLLANVWLPYQTLSCRLLARSGFYQSGGAFGFRDQLQDAMALVHHEPRLFREHILYCASRQFREGDVQHWWHPPSGRGVRTHISDDFLWLPLAVCRYVKISQDTGILQEQAPFLQGRLVKPEEEAYYDRPQTAEEVGTLYEHCVKAIRHGLRFGSHGLPLMGAGDWNDGMNLVGSEGKGESVWLAFFLYDVLKQFAELARGQGDAEFAQKCLYEAGRLQENIEQHAWDGGWYRRAYFDNGEMLGSATNAECQIDALPQSWSVISGAGEPSRTVEAMAAVNQRLVQRDARLIKLFSPPFDHSNLEPGYIKGYVPGVRENGGQYTHAAVWTTMAFALLGDHERAWELLGLINPIHHGATAGEIATYKVEPYVVAADVYAVKPHVGRGGWTWYTGSAGWMYRLILETLLGFAREGDTLQLAPRLPQAWGGFTLHYRYFETIYHITIDHMEKGGVPAVTVDGVAQEKGIIRLVNDLVEHQVLVHLAAVAAPKLPEPALAV